MLLQVMCLTTQWRVDTVPRTTVQCENVLQVRLCDGFQHAEEILLDASDGEHGVDVTAGVEKFKADVRA